MWMWQTRQGETVIRRPGEIVEGAVSGQVKALVCAHGVDVEVESFRIRRVH